MKTKTRKSIKTKRAGMKCIKRRPVRMSKRGTGTDGLLDIADKLQTMIISGIRSKPGQRAALALALAEKRVQVKQEAQDGATRIIFEWRDYTDGKHEEKVVWDSAKDKGR